MNEVREVDEVSEKNEMNESKVESARREEMRAEQKRITNITERGER